MPESIERGIKLDKIRPVRVANRFARCPFGNLVAQFYAEDLGIDRQTLSSQNLDVLSPQERTSLTNQSREKFIALMRSGLLYPEALYMSCIELPPSLPPAHGLVGLKPCNNLMLQDSI